MKRGHKFKVLLPVACMLVTLVIGCSDNKTAEKSTTGEQTKVNYNFMISDNASFPYKKDWPVIQEWEKKTNVTFTMQPIPLASYNEKKKILISTNEAPDIMVVDNPDVAQFGPDGVFLKLDDLIAKHAPNLQALFKKYPELKTIAVSPIDNKIYGMPEANLEQGQFRRTWSIRRDLMKKYGLKDPETTADFYNVLKTLKEKHPNAYPLTGEGAVGAGGLVTGMTIAFTGLQADNGIGYDPAKHEYRLAAKDPGFKDMLIYMNKLFSEGLMDVEFASLKANDVKERLAAEKSLAVYSWRTTHDGVTDTVKKATPNSTFDMFSIPPFAAPTGKRMILGWGVPEPTRLIAFSPKIKNPERAIQAIDYLYSEEGQRLSNHGVEGVSYTKKDGKFVVTEKYADTTTSTNLLRSLGARIDGIRRTVLPELAELSPRLKERDAMLKPYLVEDIKPLLETAKETETKKEKTDQVNKYYEQEVVKFIMGKSPITDANLSKFISEYDKLGAQQLVDIANEQYKRTYGGK